MKHITLLISVFICINSFGQYWNNRIPDYKIGTVDTVKKVMLVSDTSMRGSTKTFAIFGYDVLIVRQYFNEPGTICVNCGPYWEHLQYLDERKNPLNSNLIVWQKLNR
jgi:hypothetical protein